MNIKNALEITNLKNRNQLAQFLGLSHTAVYKWDYECIPEKWRWVICEKMGALPQGKVHLNDSVNFPQSANPYHPS